MTGSTAHVAAAADALTRLAVKRPELAETLARMVLAVADEATRTPRFAKSLADAMAPTDVVPSPPSTARAKRTTRRAPGVLDPFAVYRDVGEDGLRSRLSALEVDQLKDIISEHGMDHDKLAMKWRAPKRLVDRIVEKVSAAVAKGSAFR